MKTLTLVLALIALTGCETCSRHPVACAVGIAIVGGSVIALQKSRNHDSGTGPTIQPVDCQKFSCL